MVKSTRSLKARVIFFICFFLYPFLHVHLVKGQDFYLGLKVGSGWSGFAYKGSSVSEIDTEQKLNVALTYNYKFSQKYGMNVETGYSDRGVSINADNLNYNLNYLDLPLLVDYYPISRVRLSAGPEISYLISAMNKSNDGSKTNISGNFDNRWAVNGAIGANYSVSFFMDLGLRYQLPITTISKTDPTLNINNVKSRYFQLYLLFKIAN